MNYDHNGDPIGTPQARRIDQSEKLTKLQAVCDQLGYSEIDGQHAIIYHGKIRLYFDEPSAKLRDKGRHHISIRTYDGKEWHDEILTYQISFAKSAQAIAADIQRRILPDAENWQRMRVEGRERVETENHLATMTLKNCQNASCSSRSTEIRQGWRPQLTGTIHDAEVTAECALRKPNRVEITLKNLTQTAAEQVLGTVFMVQDGKIDLDGPAKHAIALLAGLIRRDRSDLQMWEVEPEDKRYTTVAESDFELISRLFESFSVAELLDEL